MKGKAIIQNLILLEAQDFKDLFTLGHNNVMQTFSCIG